MCAQASIDRSMFWVAVLIVSAAVCLSLFVFPWLVHRIASGLFGIPRPFLGLATQEVTGLLSRFGA